ncbi:MAG: glycerate kinase [Gammaproteobacteria bacterium]|nr:glycerate kinase [Gammaproteobacteria bacterium]
MRIVIAPDSFKESLSAQAAANAIESGLRRVLPTAELVKIPLADGGEGTVDALLTALGGRRVRVRVMGPLGTPVSAVYGRLRDGSVVLEMAQAAGLPLVPLARRNPLKTTTYGVGELLAHALARGARRVVLGLGGSATNDGGAGLLQALGARLLDARGRPLVAGVTGGDLVRVRAIDLGALDPRLAHSEILIACDVRNPLVGPRGAAAIYGPQKGANPAQVRLLDAHLRHFGGLLEQATGARLLQRAGAGAAGGLGAALLGVAGGEIHSGADLVLRWVGFEAALQGADLVVTGEGRLDDQTRFGKTPAAVAAVAQRLGIPVVGLAGSLSTNVNVNFRHGFDALMAAVVHPTTPAAALSRARPALRAAAERLARWLLLAQRFTPPPTAQPAR